MKNYKLKIATCYSLLATRSKGQTMIEFVLIAIISLALIFGIMDIARLSWTMFHLHGAAFAAARAVVVGKDANIAANYVTMQTIGAPCLVSVNRTQIQPTSNPSGLPPWGTIPGTALSDSVMRIYAVRTTVNYVYRPLFAYGSFRLGVPLRVSSRMSTEVPNPIPQSR